MTRQGRIISLFMVIVFLLGALGSIGVLVPVVGTLMFIAPWVALHYLFPMTMYRAFTKGDMTINEVCDDVRKRQLINDGWTMIYEGMLQRHDY